MLKRLLLPTLLSAATLAAQIIPGTASQVRIDGGWRLANVGPYLNAIEWSEGGAGIRFRAAITSVSVAGAWDNVALLYTYQDGILINTATNPGDSTFTYSVTVSGLDGAAHDYEMVPVASGTRRGDPIIGTMTVAGTGLLAQTSAQAKRKTVAWYGDSIAYGSGVTSGIYHDSWLIRPIYSPSQFGFPGTKVSDWLSVNTTMTGQNQQSIAGTAEKPDLIIVQGGVNDQTAAVDPATFQAAMVTQLNNLVSTMGLTSSTKILVRGILPKGDVPVSTYKGYQSAAVATFNASTTCTVSSICPTFVDTTSWIDPTTDLADGTHPNQGGYAKIAAAELPLIAGLLGTDTSVGTISVTSTQATVPVTTAQTSCRVEVSESPTYTPLVHDVDPALFTGADMDTRAGSIVGGTSHTFVIGKRTAEKGLDGIFYSRALAAYTAHYGRLTCGVDDPVLFAFTTSNIATGNTFNDPVGFDPLGLGNYAIPTWDWTHQVVDPQQGTKYFPITRPAEYTVGTNRVTTSSGTTDNAADVAAARLVDTGWACTALDACSHTTAAQDVLMIRLTSSNGPGGDTLINGWRNMIGTFDQFKTSAVDSIQVNLTADGAGTSRSAQLALSWNGVNQGSEWKTITIPASSGTVLYPAALSALLPAWQGTTYPLIPGMDFQQAQMNLTVTTAGSIVTATSGQFPMDPRIFMAGSRITIAGVEYTVASIQSATQITLGTAGVNGTGQAAHICNFSVMIRKATAYAAALNISAVEAKLAYSWSFGNGGSGFQKGCSPLTSTDSGGHVGRICLFKAEPGGGLYWVTNDHQSRFLGRAFLLASSYGIPGDEYVGHAYGGSAIFDPSDPNSWYTSSTLANGNPTVIKLTYGPAGGTINNWDGRAVPGDYQAFPLQSDWSSNLDNPHITVTQITRPSLGKDIYTQLSAAWKTGKFGAPTFQFVQGTIAVLGAAPVGLGSNGEIRYVHVRLSDGVVSGEYAPYMSAKCRFCRIHAPLEGDSSSSWYGMWVYDQGFGEGTGGTVTGDGPNVLTITTALQGNPTAPTHSCVGLVDSSVSSLIPYSPGCDTITFAGSDNIPCDPDPSTWETAHMPACTWGPGTQWEGGVVKVGDQIRDPATGYEVLVLGHHYSGTQWEVMRNVAIPHGTRLTDTTGPEYQKDHAANWVASMSCTFPGSIWVSTAEVDGSTLLWDQRFMNFNHAALLAEGVASAETYGSVNGLSVRMGTYPSAAGQPETYRLLNNPTFSGKAALGVGSQEEQSHVGWRHGDTYVTDFSPFAGAQGGDFGLWPQAVTHVSGDLYRIAAADAHVAMDKRRRSQGVWSGMWLLHDVSGGTIDGTSGHAWEYCSIDYAAATCHQSPEGVGDMFMNVPQATSDIGVWAGNAFDYNNFNSIPMGMEAMSMLQYFLDSSLLSYDGMNVDLGRYTRNLGKALGRNGGQDTYSNLKMIEGADFGLATGSVPNMQRAGDVYGVVVPPIPSVEVGNDFISVPVVVPSGHTYAELRFGYAEFGAPSSRYCTTRPEYCHTASPSGTPFRWAGEAHDLTAAACTGGCTLNIPMLPDHVAYYSIATSNDGSSWTDGPLSVVGSPAASGGISDTGTRIRNATVSGFKRIQ